MEVIYKDKTLSLGKKERKIGSEAPAVKVKTLDEQIKVIGMMAPKIQVMVTISDLDKYTEELNETLKKYEHKILPYIVSSKPKTELETLINSFHLDAGQISDDFISFSEKFGVNIDDKSLANSLFVIDKEGEIKYIQIPNNLESNFDMEEFSEKLHEVVTYKPKGHTHENWMGV